MNDGVEPSVPDLFPETSENDDANIRRSKPLFQNTTSDFHSSD